MSEVQVSRLLWAIAMPVFLWIAFTKASAVGVWVLWAAIAMLIWMAIPAFRSTDRPLPLRKLLLVQFGMFVTFTAFMLLGPVVSGRAAFSLGSLILGLVFIGLYALSSLFGLWVQAQRSKGDDDDSR